MCSLWLLTLWFYNWLKEEQNKKTTASVGVSCAAPLPLLRLTGELPPVSCNNSLVFFKHFFININFQASCFARKPKHAPPQWQVAPLREQTQLTLTTALPTTSPPASFPVEAEDRAPVSGAVSADGNGRLPLCRWRYEVVKSPEWVKIRGGDVVVLSGPWGAGGVGGVTSSTAQRAHDPPRSLCPLCRKGEGQFRDRLRVARGQKRRVTF